VQSTRETRYMASRGRQRTVSKRLFGVVSELFHEDLGGAVAATRSAGDNLTCRSKLSLQLTGCVVINTFIVVLFT